MRVLFTTCHLAWGGAERVFAQLLAGLPRDRFEPKLCLWRRELDYEIPSDLAVEVLQKHRPWHLPRTVLRLRSLIEEWRPDVLLSTVRTASLVAGSALAGARRRPGWVLRLDAAPEPDFRGLFRFWGRRVAPRVDRLVGVSRGVTRAGIRHLGVAEPLAVTIPNPIDAVSIASQAEAPLPFARDPNAYVVVHAGRLVPVKNQRLLLESFSRIPHARAELWMLGRGPLEPALRRLSARLGIADRVRWLGFRANPFPFFRAADVLALSSESEGFANVLVEAAACGTPAISTRCPYGPEEVILDGETGLLVPIGDPNAMGAALTHLADDVERRARLGAAALERVRAEYAPAGILARYGAALEEAAALGRRRSSA